MLTCEIKDAVSIDSTCPHPETTNTPPVLQTQGCIPIQGLHPLKV